MRKTYLVLSTMLQLIILNGCGLSSNGRVPYIEAEGAAWNTTYRVVYRSDKDLSDSIISVMREVEMSLSPFCDSSTISKINRNEPALTGPIIKTVFKASQEINRLSGGAFDPTVGPLVNLWGFGENGQIDTAPTQEMIDSALASVGIGRCAIIGDSLIKPTPDTRFNFSAITKGLGCDMVGKMLRRNGCNDYMVEIGGEIALAGQNRYGKPWRIMIDAPIDNDSTLTHRRMATIELTDKGIATSGNYRNFKRLDDGKHVAHTISPISGTPVKTSTLSVTAIAPDAMTADAIATACMVMNPDSAIAMADKIDYVSILVVIQQDNGWELRRSNGFPPLYE